MDQFSIILEQPVQSEDPDDWSIRMEVGIKICVNVSLLIAHQSELVILYNYCFFLYH